MNKLINELLYSLSYMYECMEFFYYKLRMKYMEYKFFCLYNGVDFEKCPNNNKGMCKTVYTSFPINLLHKFDGKNVIKCLCG